MYSQPSWLGEGTTGAEIVQNFFAVVGFESRPIWLTFSMVTTGPSSNKNLPYNKIFKIVCLFSRLFEEVVRICVQGLGCGQTPVDLIFQITGAETAALMHHMMKLPFHCSVP